MLKCVVLCASVQVAARRAARAAEADGARAREDAQYCAWAALEHAFHLQQARLRSHIRVRDQRGEYSAAHVAIQEDHIFNKKYE